MEPTVRTGSEGRHSSLPGSGSDPDPRRVLLGAELASHVCTAAGGYRLALAEAADEAAEAIRGGQLASQLGRELDDGQDATVTELG